MRVPNEVHTSRPWRIREIAPDFEVEDVWELPAYGRAEDFPAWSSWRPRRTRPPRRCPPACCGRRGTSSASGSASAGFPKRTTEPPATSRSRAPAETSLADRLPDDLRGTVADLDFGSVPFVPLYRTDREFAAEISNQTVHGVLHLAWVDLGQGRFQGQMAVYVKPRGRFGKAYMAFIKPFRYLIVYPALMRQIQRRWGARRPKRS